MRLPRRTALNRGMTLMELLVVLGVIAILAALSLPAMKGIGQSNILASANRQVLDDLALARQLAIKDRTTVHFVFVPTNVYLVPLPPANSPLYPIQVNLRDAAYTTYALFAERSAGDQPGRPHFRYVRLWRSLPDGTMFSPSVFAGPNALPTHGFPFPTSDGRTNGLPYLSFDQNGSLVDVAGTRMFQDQYLEVARGSIFAVRNAGGMVIDLDVQERPPGSGALNRIHIHALTGRARLEQPQIQ